MGKQQIEIEGGEQWIQKEKSPVVLGHGGENANGQ